MEALLTPKSAKRIGLVVATFLLATPLIYPEVLLPQVVLASNAQTGDNQSLVFEIKDPALIQKTLNPNSLSFENLVQNDPLAVKLKAYLESYNSPLAEYADEIIQQPQWQRALAISWVESNYGQHCYNENCSGIGVQPGHPAWRKYNTKLDWFKDMTQLLEKPIYKEKYTTFEKMKGIYVNPGSASWVYGAKTKYAELMSLTKDAQEERELALQDNLLLTSSAASSPLLAQLTK
jgi:hypothetical protein